MRLNLLISLIALVVSMGVATASFGQGDTDGDGIDDFFDNCTDQSNAAQVDSDFDGCGNLCDGDFDQDGVVEGNDFSIFRAAFSSNASGVTNMDGEEGTRGLDFIRFRDQFQQGVPGPSENTFRDLSVCP